MTKRKLPFDLELNSIEADRYFLPVYPENKHWFVVLKGTEAGKKIASLCEFEEAATSEASSDARERRLEQSDRVGIWLDKIYGLYQEERQLLEKQIEDYRNEILGYQKFLATVASQVGLELETIEKKLQQPFEESLEDGLKLEPYLEEFGDRSKKLARLRTRMDEDSIEVIIRKRLKIGWSKEETSLLHEGMKAALSEFISNEQNGWKEKPEPRAESREPSDESGKNIENPIGSESTTISNTSPATPDLIVETTATSPTG
jgi:hypothetical protein